MSPVKYLSICFLKRRLIARSRRHRLGYNWALSELHKGNDVEPFLFMWQDKDLAFDIGISDAMHDFNTTLTEPPNDIYI